jgi:hypothetical protein
MTAEPAPMQRRPPMTQPCPVCGGVLREQVSGCSTCPMNSGCDMLCCENCGYETVAPQSVTIALVKKVVSFVSRKKPADPAGHRG